MNSPKRIGKCFSPSATEDNKEFLKEMWTNSLNSQLNTKKGAATLKIEMEKTSKTEKRRQEACPAHIGSKQAISEG